jgi:aromatic-amino-acid transaminase
MSNQLLFSTIPQAPSDPILGLTEKFLVDKNPEKINLGVGVYQNELGKAAKLKAVFKAESKLLETDLVATYLPMDGLPDFRTAAQQFLFGKNVSEETRKRIATCQTPGGTGAIRIGADFLKLFAGNAEVFISNPSWDNHQAIIGAAGFPISFYPYYNDNTKSLDFEACFASLMEAKKGSIILLHAACHNPTGYDFSDEQWQRIKKLCVEREFIPFLDIAYQGFDKGFEEDTKIIHEFLETGLTFLVASSCSKNLGLYAERTGALSVVCGNAEIASKAQSQLKRIVRTIYSSPPARGAKIVQTIVADPGLYSEWQDELSTMRERLKRMRASFTQNLKSLNLDFDFSHIATQNGMFSYSGLSKDVIIWLRENKSIYALESGRICVAAINDNNIDRIVSSIAEAIKAQK